MGSTTAQVGTPDWQEHETKIAPSKPKQPQEKPLSDTPQMLVLQQEHPVSPPHSERGSARARSLLQTALLGQALSLKLFINYLSK